MLDFISHQNFELVQLGILSMSIAYDIKKKDSYGSIFSNSLIYKTIIALLTICVIILSFELKWWIAILYLIFSFIIHAFIAGLLVYIFIPKSYFQPEELYLNKPTSHTVGSIFIIFNYIVMTVLLIISGYTLFQ